MHTYSGYEKKVKDNLESAIINRHLENQIFEVRIPLQDVVEVKNGVRKNVQRKMFPGYVLVNMDMNDETWYVVRNTRGVTGFVGPGSEPTPLSEAEVKALGVDIPSTVSLDFAVGDQVQVCGTAMDGFVGVVQKIDLDENTVDVLVSMFGRDTQATLALNQVRKIED